MLKLFITAFLSLLCIFGVSAQEQYTDSVMARKEYRDLERVKHLWFHTANASGLSLDYFENGTIATVSGSRNLYGYRRGQEGDANSELNLMAERFDKIGRYFNVYSKFTMDKGTESNRAWSDVVRTYNSNPYMFGSAIAGDYDLLNFGIQAKVATSQIHRFTFGVGLNYKVGDLSRQRDPRSRNKWEELSVKPGITYQLHNNHTVGLLLSYAHRKERVDYTTASTQTFGFYVFTGLENETISSGTYSSFYREFVDEQYGLELNYAYMGNCLQSLLNVSADFGKENVWNTTYKGSPGNYKTNTFNLQWMNKLQYSHALHTLNLTAKYNYGAFTELKQQRVTETNSTTGSTTYYWETLFTYKNRYQAETADVHLAYTLYGMKGDFDYNYYVGASARYNYFKNRYNLPHSQLMVRNYELMLNGGARLIQKKSAKLWVEPEFAYHNAISPSLYLNDETTDIAVNVLIPDMNYYNANYYRGALSIQYLFPVKVKEFNNLWYVKLRGEQLWANGAGKSRGVSFTVGLYTL